MDKRLIKIFLAINIIILFFLVTVSFLFSWKNTDLLDEHVIRFNDSILGNIIGIVLVLSVSVIITYRKDIIDKMNTRYLALAFSVMAVALALYWVLNSGTAPQADARAVCEAASNINAGDYSDFKAGEYVTVYPQQLGLITIIRVVFLVFGDMNYVCFQILSAVAVFGIVYSTYEIACILSGYNKVVEFFSLLIVCLFLPMYMYTAFVYGEIISTSFVMMAIVLYLKACQKMSQARLLLLTSTVMLAIMARQNTIIFIIAMIGTLVFKLIFNDKKKSTLIILVAIIAGLLFQNILIKCLYDSHWKKDVDHLPALLWIAMGTNDDYERSGWYNGLGTKIFWDNDLDAEASKKEAKEVIKNFLGVCKDNPTYGFDFYFRKISSQWCAPMFQGLVMNNNIEGKQSSIIDTIYHNETIWKIMDEIMNIYQIVVYLSVLVLLLYIRKGDVRIEYLVGLIAVFGGFLFSILWEAKTRYILSYMIILLPYAAVGLNKIFEKNMNNKE